MWCVILPFLITAWLQLQFEIFAKGKYLKRCLSTNYVPEILFRFCCRLSMFWVGRSFCKFFDVLFKAKIVVALKLKNQGMSASAVHFTPFPRKPSLALILFSFPNIFQCVLFCKPATTANLNLLQLHHKLLINLSVCCTMETSSWFGQ